MAAQTIHDYMRAYANDHTHPMNKLTHMVGIPMILASLPMMLVSRKIALSTFAAGWALQFAGHAFEGKKPSFASDLRYLAIGPVWITLEWVAAITGEHLYTPPAVETPVPEHKDVPIAQAA